MPDVVIGARTIEYRVRRSERAGRKRIEVMPAGVEVIVLAGAAEEEVRRFVDARRRWLHDKTEEVREEVERLNGALPSAPPRPLAGLLGAGEAGVSELRGA